MILAIVHPTGVSVFAGKLMAIELADEILSSRATKRSTRIDVADQHPLLLVCTTYGQLHQVRTLPHTIVAAVSLSETTLIGPVLQVW